MCKFLSAALLLLVLGSAQTAEPDRPTTAYAEWSMSLDVQGHVMDLKLKPGRVTELLRGPLERAIRSWEFEPGTVNNEPAPTETTLVIKFSVALTSDNEAFVITLDDVHTGGSIKHKEKLPSLTWFDAREKARIGAPSLLILRVTYDSHGKPTDVIVEEGSPITEGKQVKDSIKVVRSWTFEPERVAGHGVVAQALVPICYVYDESTHDPRKCIRDSVLGKRDFSSGRSLALDSSVKLKSDVIGRTL
jgi:hypothetical protein